MGDAIEKTSIVIKAEKESTEIEKQSKEKLIVPTESCEEKIEKLHEVDEVAIKIKAEVEKEGNMEGKVEKAKTELVANEENKKENIEVPVKEDMSKEKVLKEDLGEQSVKKVSDSVPCCPKQPKEKIIRNQSDIFSLKDLTTTLQTSIFSVNGSPSRRLFRKQEPAGHDFQKNEDPPSDKTATSKSNRITRENYNDEKRPSSSYRNPLTGTGLSSNDEYKSKGTKRKDGNPLLGLGYDSEVAASSSQHRIPPGGYSHKLW